MPLTASAMPSRSSTLLKCTPLVAPCAGSTYTSDFAFSSVVLNASLVVMSGFGAPSRTPTPMPVRARSARLPEASAPCLIMSSMPASVRITTSTGSPLRSFCRVWPAVPNENVTVLPVSCRNCPARSVTIARTAPALNTFTSSAPAGPAASTPSPIHIATTVARMIFMIVLSRTPGRARPPARDRSAAADRPALGSRASTERLGGDRQRGDRHAQRPHRVRHRVGHRGGRADGAALAHALVAAGRERGGRLQM